MASDLSKLPKVDQVLDALPLRELPWRHAVKKRLAQDVIDSLRSRLRKGETVDVPDATGVAALVVARLDSWARTRPRRVINATGVILHTNLGRAPLGERAVSAAAEAASYCDLEIGLDDGKRGSRFVWLRPLLAATVEAEDVHVVNNNAAALLLACTVLGDPGGVVLSRGQMVEIGDGFRVATMAGAGGCRVVAVGSTNRTHLGDYEQALDGEGSDSEGRPASALLWVHRSNFSQDGFVSDVSLAELGALARQRGVPLIADLGAGSLGTGLPEGEPSIQEYIKDGADLVLCSGDKLLGGPQAGILAGRAEFVHRCRRFPMARALRPDKMTVAALHATFLAHAQAHTPDLPLFRMVRQHPQEIKDRAAAVADALGWGERAVVATQAAIGGGSLPGDTMESFAVVVPADRPARVAKRLRTGALPVVGRIDAERLLLDLRTVAPDDDANLIDMLRAAVPSSDA